MTDREKIQSGKVTLDIEIQDLLNMVSKSGSRPALSEYSNSHGIDGEDLKKAWFNHMLISMEKLNDLIESVRRVDLSNLKAEFKEDLKRLENSFDKSTDDLKAYKKDIAEQTNKHRAELELYKKEVIAPLNTKVLTLSIKLGVWATIAGFAGSGLMAILIYIINEYVIKRIASGP